MFMTYGYTKMWKLMDIDFQFGTDIYGEYVMYVSILELLWFVSVFHFLYICGYFTMPVMLKFL